MTLTEGHPADGVTAEDHAYFAGVVAGEPTAFAALFERYYDALCAFAEGYVATPDEAEEVVQETFVRLWTRRERLTITTSVKSYLYAATRNQALNHLRRVGTEQRWLEREAQGGETPGLGAPLPGAAAELHASELAQAVNAAIPQLSERCRQVFLLHRRHGLTYAEIAEALGISHKTVENHLGRALQELRRLLSAFLSD